ncbi:hypothetical protein L486_08539 [Kwoniella mangroviensis CBS 10435]|uniref:Zn(2)-C6 fungal-type domain-containing protein n=1 Tax=Kwoniella mangroviensis CBS 10435 TaxID=1331196 RepID=A0A1B9IEV4_9TREE|nr:hypothetical protein L486_08539 [Kwoniella mangroviensis CBS 10435]
MNNQLSLQNMQRHFSDTAYLPQVSSRLNPNPNVITRPSRGLPVGTVQQRGTMSMPTSPIMKKMVIQPTTSPAIDRGQEIWDSPQTAQAFFSSLYQQQQQQQSQQQNNPHPGQTNNQAQSQDQIQLQNQDQTPNSGFNHHVSPMDLKSSSSGYYDTSSQPPTTSSLQYISPQSTRFQTQPPNTGSGMGLGIGMDIASPFINHAGFSNQAPSPTINNQVQQDEGEDHDMDFGAGTGTGADTGTGGRKKRIQVRIACTHCQKACKKCSNTRPCERCVKYGLTDCVDSTRKSRKTGIKRGPYKRRSSKYSATGHPHPLSGDGGGGDSPKTKMNIPPHQFPNQTLNSNPISNHSHIQPGFHLSKINHTRANFSHLPHTHTEHQSTSTAANDNLQSPQPNPSPLYHQASSTLSQSITYPPFPKPTLTASNNLVAAISNALSLPQQSQWLDGQRLPLNANTNTNVNDVQEEENENENGKTSPLYPKTPVGVFPFSLVGGREDPFSRAVSPIKQFEFDFDFGNTNDNGTDNRNGLTGVREEMEGVEEDLSRSISTSVPSTLPLPNITANQSTNGTSTNTKSLRVSSQPMIDSRLPMDLKTGAYTPFVLPSKIRKPSLRTLMSTTTSRAPSPTAPIQTQGTSNPLYNIDIEVPSPTLFTACADDSGMLLDVDDIEGWNTPWPGKSEDGGVEGDDGIRNDDGGENGLFEGIVGLH